MSPDRQWPRWIFAMLLVALVVAIFLITSQGYWSQILFENEVLMALNTHSHANRGAEITVDASLHPDGSTMTFIYKSDWTDSELREPPQDQKLTVRHRGGRATIRLDLPPSGMVILA